MSSSVNFLVLIIFLKILLISTHKHNFTFLISGGYRPAEHTLVKHAVSIKFNQPSFLFGVHHFCGGSIISPQIILTAAHCVWNLEGKRNNQAIAIVAATPNRLVRTRETQILDVEEIVLHPNYDYETSSNDIAILHLTSSIHEDGVHAQRISLPDGPAEYGMECTVVGWGTLFDGGPAAANALYIDIYIINSIVCKIIYRQFWSGMLCAGDVLDNEKDSCRGDSGGPLICENKLYGIVSYGAGCGLVPGVYTDVWYYRDWILTGGNDSKSIKLMNVLLLTLLVWIVI